MIVRSTWLSHLLNHIFEASQDGQDIDLKERKPPTIQIQILFICPNGINSFPMSLFRLDYGIFCISVGFYNFLAEDSVLN